MKIHHYISYIFHPVLVPMVSALLYFILAPLYIPKEFTYRILLVIFVMTYFIPLLMLYLLKKIGLIENYQLPSIDERKFPILFVATLCFLIGKLLLKTNSVDLLAYSFFGCTISLGLVYVLFYKNIKASLHTLGIAGMITFLSIISFEFKTNLLVLILLSFILLGIVATSRLKLEAHKLSEIFIGMILGFFSQMVAYLLYLN